MTINNLFANIHKKKERKDMITSRTEYTAADYDRVTNFNYTLKSA